MYEEYNVIQFQRLSRENKTDTEMEGWPKKYMVKGKGKRVSRCRGKTECQDGRVIRIQMSPKIDCVPWHITGVEVG